MVNLAVICYEHDASPLISRPCRHFPPTQLVVCQSFSTLTSLHRLQPSIHGLMINYLSIYLLKTSKSPWASLRLSTSSANDWRTLAEDVVFGA